MLRKGKETSICWIPTMCWVLPATWFSCPFSLQRKPMPCGKPKNLLAARKKRWCQGEPWPVWVWSPCSFYHKCCKLDLLLVSDILEGVSTQGHFGFLPSQSEVAMGMHVLWPWIRKCDWLSRSSQTKRKNRMCLPSRPHELFLWVQWTQAFKDFYFWCFNFLVFFLLDWEDILRSYLWGFNGLRPWCSRLFFSHSFHDTTSTCTSFPFKTFTVSFLHPCNNPPTKPR